MTLIASISGIRGTIGGSVGDGLTPLDIVKFSAAYGTWIKKKTAGKPTVVIGRDARISGPMVSQIVIGTLQGLGIDVINLGLSTTPTVEVAVPEFNSDGGIILTASHNPKEWNALKLLNHKGEFISGEEGADILAIAEREDFAFADIDTIGVVREEKGYIEKHIDQVLELSLVDVKAIREKNYKVVIDCVNSTGGLALPMLLKKLGVAEIIELYCEPNGQFPHNPEPLPEHLTAISDAVVQNKANLGIVVDPDVDRLAFVSEDGTMFGEEYTLVAIADYVLQNKAGATVSNLSSSRALRDVTIKHKGTYHASAVGEVNVVKKMKEQNAIIGGEGNGGIIYPESHYGRDALVGIALFLSHLAKSNISCKVLRESYPSYYMTKSKIQLTPELNIDEILVELEDKYQHADINTIDGLKIDFEDGWVHLRKSNTEPIVRVYAESTSAKKAAEFVDEIKQQVDSIAKTTA